MNFSNYQRTLIGIMIIGLVLLGGYIYALSCRGGLSGSELSCSTAQKVLPFVDAIPFVLFVALLAGAIAFYFLLPPAQPSKFNKATLKFLSADEKIIVQRLVEKKGEALQTELTQLEGMNKVRSHRTIKKLQQKGVIEVVQKGKTNIVKLSPEIYSQ